MNILEFPCNLLLEILSYIDKRTIIASVRKVCQSFHRLSFDRSLWKTLTMKQFPRTVFTTKSFHKLLTGVKHSVQCLHLDMDKLDDMGMLHEGITCSNLKELYINAPPEATEDIADFIGDLEQMIEHSAEWEHIINLKKYLSSFDQRYPNLKALHIQSAGLDVGYLSDMFLNLETLSISEGILQDSCRVFFQNHPSIKHMSLKKCTLEPSAVPTVLSQLPKMETVDFSGTEDYFNDWEDATNVVKHNQFCSLRELCIDNKRDKFLSQVCNIMPELRKLSIIGSWVKDKELIEIAKHCPKLETVLINDSRETKCYATNDALCAIASSCTNLQVLRANYCTKVDSIGIQRIIESCPNLRELEMANCETLTDDDMISLVEKCPRIQKLSLQECTGLTSKSISAILIGCKSLTDLDLQLCYTLVDIRITDDSSPNVFTKREYSENETDILEKEIIKLDDEAKAYKQPIKAHSHIRSLNLQCCVNLRDSCLEQISSVCPDLRDVHLEQYSSITNQGVTSVVKNCRLLEKLNLSCRSNRNPSKLSDKCLSSIAKYCKTLRILKIMAPTIHITANGLFEVIINCPRIENIELSECTMDRFSLYMNKLKMLMGNVTGKVVRMERRRIKLLSYRRPLNIYIYSY